MNETVVLQAAQDYQTASEEQRIAQEYANEMMTRYQEADLVAREKLEARNEAEQALKDALNGGGNDD